MSAKDTRVGPIKVTLSVEELVWIIEELPPADGLTKELREQLSQHVGRELGF